MSRQATNYRSLLPSDEQKMEYAKVIVAPDYYQLDPSDFDLAPLGNGLCFKKFHHLTHSQVLGTIVHQFGCGAQVLWRYSDE